MTGTVPSASAVHDERLDHGVEVLRLEVLGVRRLDVADSRAVWILVLAVLAAVLVSAAVWVHLDAQANGLPRLPWVVVTLLLPLLGLALYLLAREIRNAA